MRPEPERVCPQAGCKTINVGAVLVHHNGTGCVAVGLVSGPGKSAQKLVPWAGSVTPKVPDRAFPQAPESQLTIRDFATCGTLQQGLAHQDEEMVRTIRAVFSGSK